MIERVVLVIDVSESMRTRDYPPSRLDAAKEAVLSFVRRKTGIDDRDEIGLVAFAWRSETLREVKPVRDHGDELAQSIKILKPGPGTAIGSGLLEAGRLLGILIGANPKNSVNSKLLPRIVLLSDGENNRGPSPCDIAVELKRQGVIIDAIGIGEKGLGRRSGLGLDEETLASIASPGHYRHISDSRDLVLHFEGLAEKVLLPSGDSDGGLERLARRVAAHEPRVRVLPDEAAAKKIPRVRLLD